MYCGTLEVTARHPVPLQTAVRKITTHTLLQLLSLQPLTAATISLNASQGGTGDSQSGAGAVYTVSWWLLLTLGNLQGAPLYTWKQLIKILCFVTV